MNSLYEARPLSQLSIIHRREKHGETCGGLVLGQLGGAIKRDKRTKRVIRFLRKNVLVCGLGSGNRRSAAQSFVIGAALAEAVADGFRYDAFPENFGGVVSGGLVNGNFKRFPKRHERHRVNQVGFGGYA